MTGGHRHFLRTHACLCLGTLLVFPGVGRGDGGTVRLSEEVHGYRVTVFTAPTLVRAGPVDLSVMVQRADGGEPLPDSRVTVSVAPLDRPADVTRLPATVQAATNKLLHAAQFNLPAPGRWTIAIDIAGPLGPARTGFVLDAAEPLPRWVEMWPWLAWPIIPVVLFLVHQALVRRRAGAGRAGVPPGAPARSS